MIWILPFCRLDIAYNFGVSKEIFKEEYFSDKYAKIVSDCFALAEQLGVSTYPSVVAIIEGKANDFSGICAVE